MNGFTTRMKLKLKSCIWHFQRITHIIEVCYIKSFFSDIKNVEANKNVCKIKFENMKKIFNIYGIIGFILQDEHNRKFPLLFMYISVHDADWSVRDQSAIWTGTFRIIKDFFKIIKCLKMQKLKG